ncbi:MAG: energy transducer TonB [bacterium]|nr:energy transducer TonB [bacterium]
MIRHYNLLELSLLASLTAHSVLFFAFSGRERAKKANPPIPITLVYSEVKKTKPLPLPIPKPIQPKKEIQNPSPLLPLIKPLVAEESIVPEEAPLFVPKVEKVDISTPPAVIQEPILGKEGSGGIGGEGTETALLEPEEPPIFEAKDLDEGLKVTKYVPPEHPSLTGRDSPGGLILLKILVNQEGEPAQIEILKDELKAYPSFSKNTKKAVQEWRFSKPTINKCPVCVWYILPIRFKASH